jgi:hypothetical protein
MRAFVLLGTAAALALGVSSANALGGGNLTFGESPYAIWEPEAAVPFKTKPDDRDGTTESAAPSSSQKPAASPQAPKKTP